MKKIILLLFVGLALSLNAQITENFEGDTFPPDGWAVFAGTNGESDMVWEHQEDSSYWSIGWVHTGSLSAISSFNMVDEEDDPVDASREYWLVTPQFTPTEDNHTLYFHQRQAYPVEWESEFKILVSEASQTSHDDFTFIIEIQNEDDLSYNKFEPHTVDLSAHIGHDIYLAFVHAAGPYGETTGGDEWYIDDVLTSPIELPGACTNPSPADGATDIPITNTQLTEIFFNWEAPTTGGDILQYDFFVGASPDEVSVLGHPTDFIASPDHFRFNTTYYWKAAATNMMGETTPLWSFTTVDQPTVTIPYVIDFEIEEGEDEGHIPDACDQFITNDKWWKFTDTASGHIGNNGDFEGTTTESNGYFAYVNDYETPSAMNTTFTTPYIDFGDVANPAVSFYINSNNEGGANVNFSVKKRALGIDDSCITIFESNTNTAGWEKVVLAFEPDDCGAIFQLLFVIDEIEDSTKDYFAIDDIKFDDYSNLAVNKEPIAGLRYFPNPVKDVLNIHADETINQIAIYNLIGQLVQQTTADNNNITLDISELSIGNYFVKIISDNKQNTIKIVKE